MVHAGYRRPVRRAGQAGGVPTVTAVTAEQLHTQPLYLSSAAAGEAACGPPLPPLSEQFCVLHMQMASKRSSDGSSQWFRHFVLFCSPLVASTGRFIHFICIGLQN